MRKKKATVQKPKVIWANQINLAGLWSPIPERMKWDELQDCWWDRNGWFSIPKLGFYTRYDSTIIGFSSENKKEVEIWTRGALAVLNRLGNWTKASMPHKKKK